MKWIQAQAFFNRIMNRDERHEVRLRKLERLMEDFPGRPHSQAMTSAVGAFTTLQGDNEWKDDRHYRIEDDAQARESLARVERLKRSFRSRTPKKSTLRHVRPMRPVPADVVAWARLLGVSI